MRFDTGYFQFLTANAPLRDRARRWLTPRVRPLFARLEATPHAGRVLDVGSGRGGLLQALSWSRPDLEYFALDLAAAPEFLAPAHRIMGSASRLPFDDGSFSGILLSHVLEHLQDPEPALTEIQRVLVPGGWLYVETPNQRSALTPFGLNFWDDPTHVRPYSTQALRHLLAMYGYSDVSAGAKVSAAGVILGLPYAVISRRLKDPTGAHIFPVYAFGLFSYGVGIKRE